MKDISPYLRIPWDGSDRRILCSSVISSSFSLSINIRSRVPVLLLVILNGASKSYTISWLYQNFSSCVLNDSRDLAVTTVSGRLFHGSVIRNIFFLRFSLAFCVK